MTNSPAALLLPAQRLSTPDLALVALYLIAITLFGLRFRERKGAPKQDKSLKSYFLANNTIPWWAIALSIVSAETSTLTIISIPGVAFAGDFGFLQIVLGYMLGRIVVAVLFLPRYFSGNMLTAYQLIDQRFGPVLHKVTAALFLLTRAAAEGVRVFAVSIVVGIAIGTRDVLSIAIISALTLLYTFEGGLTAVIWTDVVQMAIYIGGTFVAILTLGRHIPGGWHTIHTIAGNAGKFHMLNFAFNLTQSYTFWAGILGGTFLTMASHGTDQLMVQRMLAARSLRESRLALLSSGVVIFIQFALFLLIGAGLYVFYGAATTPGAPSVAGLHPATGGMATISHSSIANLSPDRIFPTFIVREMPIGIAGLLVAAILAAAMSNLSAALNSLSSTTVVDFYMRFREARLRVPHVRDGLILANVGIGAADPSTAAPPTISDRERNLVAKASTVLWAIVLFAIAIYSLSVGGKGHVVEIGLSIASVAYGCLLGVFLLGTLTKFATQWGASIGMLCGFALNLWLWQGTFPKVLWQGDLMSCPDSKIVSPGTVSLGRCTVSNITIPHIAFTWYVLIGALVTFAIGSLASLIFRKQSRRSLLTTTPLLLLLLFLLSSSKGTCFLHAQAQQSTVTPGFTPISTLLTTAIAAHKLPGAVVVIGHNNQIAFEQAYGNRKLPNEPGLDGAPSPAEPMTEDTIFDMASLTKDLATATAIMQLYEAGKITSFDDPIEKYLPAFNEPHDPQRTAVTIRELLTHTSGEPADVDLRDPWGLASPDKAEGLHRALTTPLAGEPGAKFVYSDINFILLGDLIETLSGQPEDVYATEHIFKPLGMTETRYLPLAKACGPHKVIGAAIAWAPAPPGRIGMVCPKGNWSTSLLPRIAPTTHDDESKSNPAANPHFDLLTRGTVHDPTTRRMGGVAGHAGVFSTAHDISLYAQALLDKLIRNTGPFPLKQSTLQLMTTPEQPGHTPNQIPAANAAEAAFIAAGDKPAEPGLAPNYPAIKGQTLRGYGWDIDTGFSKPRGMIFPVGSFGHTGFTGTSLWMDPASGTYVILLANAIHPRGNPPISNLRGQLATAAALALGLHTPGAPSSATASSSPKVGIGEADLSREVNAHPEFHEYTPTDCNGVATGPPITVEQQIRRAKLCATMICDDVQVCAGNPQLELHEQRSNALIKAPPPVLTGIDILEQTQAAALHILSNSPDGTLNLGLLTNQSGLDSQGRRTLDYLYSLASAKIHLTILFSPEHGIFGSQDSEKINAETDPATGLHVTSLYGPKDSDKRPTHDQLKDLDAVVIDLQDLGVHFWTYESVLGYFLEAASHELHDFDHRLNIILLDRPNPVGGLAQQGPMVDPDLTSYVAYMPVPVRHGLTYGELAQYINATKHLEAPLAVVTMQNWHRSMFWSDTHLPWINPSPNLRSPEAAILYPALGLIEYSNLSVGRGTPHPLSFFGAGKPTTPGAPSSPTVSSSAKVGSQGPWFNAKTVAGALTARHIPGVTFTPTLEPIAEDPNHYPFHGQTIEAVHVTCTDPTLLDTPELGIEILSTLHHLYPTQFHLQKTITLLANQSTLDALLNNEDPRTIAATWQPSLTTFRTATTPYLLYQ